MVRSTVWSGAIGSALFTLMLPIAAIAQVNPSPSIFSQPPYNRVPRQVPAAPTTPPLPEQRQQPSGQIRMLNGQVNVKLVNKTGAAVSYQVIGDTQYRTLEGRTDVTLRTLRPPVTLTMKRQDGGLLQIGLNSATDGLLEVTLTEATDLSVDKSALVIEPSGDVFLN